MTGACAAARCLIVAYHCVTICIRVPTRPGIPNKENANTNDWLSVPTLGPRRTYTIGTSGNSAASEAGSILRKLIVEHPPRKMEVYSDCVSDLMLLGMLPGEKVSFHWALRPHASWPFAADDASAGGDTPSSLLVAGLIQISNPPLIVSRRLTSFRCRYENKTFKNISAKREA